MAAQKPEVPGIQIDPVTYSTDKAAGRVAVAKIFGATHFSRKKYDPDTGQPVQTFVRVNRDDVARLVQEMADTLPARKAMLDAQLAGLRSFLADLDAAAEVATATTTTE
jgi:hypothetical protein